MSNWTSDVCVCEHFLNKHYKKNYRITPPNREGTLWGNVDFKGCEGSLNCDCKQLENVRIPIELRNFEWGMIYVVTDEELRNIYYEEIHTKTTPYQWIMHNTERYVKLLKARSVSFERKSK